MKPHYRVNGTTSRDLALLGIMPTTLDNSIPIENVHCLIQFLLYRSHSSHKSYHTLPQGIHQCPYCKVVGGVRLRCHFKI